MTSDIARKDQGQTQEAPKSRLTLYIIAAIVLAIITALAVPAIAVGLLGKDRRASLPFFEAIGIGGEIFLRVLTMMVVPLVMASVMSGIIGLGDVRKLGRPGGFTLLYYLVTTVLAVATGLLVVNLIRPGEGFEETPEPQSVAQATNGIGATFEWDLDGDGRFGETGDDATHGDEIGMSPTFDAKGLSAPQRITVTLKVSDTRGRATTDTTTVIIPGVTGALPLAEAGGPYTVRADGTVQLDATTMLGDRPTVGTIVEGLVLMLFTDNLVSAAAEMRLLPLIVFSIIFAGMLTTMGARVSRIKRMIVQVNDALLAFILLLMKVAPAGIFCLVAARFGTAHAQGQFVEVLKQTSSYVITVLVGLAIHATATLPLIYWIFTRRNPYRFMYQMAQALLTAFSTASSSATLPVTMECAVEKGGVSKQSTEFVLPLGATINMDGTALYEAAAALFIAQVIARDLSLFEQLTVAVTATLAAIGAAGIPEAGLVTMLIVLNAVGLPLAKVALIIPVDWFLDRFRTATNTFGDSVGAAVVDRAFQSRHEADEEPLLGQEAPA